jgi:mRNA interferase RelE/StbE
MYKVIIEKKALKALEKFAESDYQKIKTEILQLQDNPRPHGCKKLKGRDAYRIRIGDYRVIYEIRDKILLVSVILIGHRKDIYNY